MNEKKVQKQTFLQGTAVLAMATILVKLMGFLFKTPLNNIIGSTGFGYFNTAYDVYNVLLMISTTGLPVAMSRMISEAQALGNEAQIKRIFKTAIYVFIAIGVAGSLVMLVFCRQLSVMVTNSENSWAAIAALAPCVLLICLISAYRGFFQGQSSMTPTSVSQIFESITRLVVGLGLAWLVMELTGERFVHENGIVLEPGQPVTDYGDITLAAGGAILGVTLGCLISVIYLHVKYRGASSALADAAGTPKSGRATMKELLSIAVPITLGSAGLQIINLFDTMIYMRRLELGLGWSVEMAENLKGVYNYQQTIFALPCAFIPTITIACIPAITAALTRRELDNVRATEESAIRPGLLLLLVRIRHPHHGAGRHAVRGGPVCHGGAGHPAAVHVLHAGAAGRGDQNAHDPRRGRHLQLPRPAVQRLHAGTRRRDLAGHQHVHRRHRQDRGQLRSRRHSRDQHRRRAGRDACLLRRDHRAQLLCPAPLRQGKSPHFPQPDPASDRVRHHGRGHVHGLPGAADAPALRAAGVPGGAAVRGVPVPHSGRCAALHHL